MNTYTQILYQVVYGTKGRRPVLTKPGRSQLFKYKSGILKNLNCKVFIINGVEDHVHLIFSLHPSVALAKLVQTLKVASSKYIKEQALFDKFIGWQTGYSAFTYTKEARPNLIAYVERQEEHHRKRSYRDEVKLLLKLHGVEYSDQYLD